VQNEQLRARLGDRDLFPLLEAMIYLNHAGISPPSVAIRVAVKALLADYERRGAQAYVPWHTQRARLKEKLAGMIGAKAEHLALTGSTTRGVVDVALCFPWRRGDRVVVFEGEFPANVTPWQRAAAMFELEVVSLPLTDYAEGNEPGLARLEAELARGVRLIAVSAVQFQTGLRMPLAAMSALAHAHGAEIFVDAVQACGAVPIDVAALGVDYLACGSHKWLMGLEGAGMLYVSPARAPALRQNIAGWLSHEGGLSFLFEGPGHLRYDRPIRKSVDFLEIGNLSAASFAALEASLDRILEIGVHEIYAHVNSYHDGLEPGLVERGFKSLRAAEPDRRSGILGVIPPDGVGVVALQQALDARGIVCGIPDGVLRFAPHWPNNVDEVEQILAAIDLCLADLRR
jgi:cysteine desulfurase / selenocysteine lyase